MQKLYKESEIRCWSDEWKRTNPDMIVYLPKGEDAIDAHNEQFLVVPSLKGSFLAFWTQSSYEGDGVHRVVTSRSEDKGKTWSKPIRIDGPDGDGRIANWAFPIIVPSTGRIYLFYNKNIGVVDGGRELTGVLKFKYSDDDAHTWQDGGTLPIRRTATSNDDPNVPLNWIVWQTPILDSKGRVFAPFTRSTSRQKQPEKSIDDPFASDCEACFLRFDNILTELDPTGLTLTTLPKGEHGIRIPHPEAPQISAAVEPAVRLLPDGQMFCVMRTASGYPWWAVSNDDGETWSGPQPLRYYDDGPVVMHPQSPCPLYALNDGRYILIFHNNDGLVYGDGKPVWKMDGKPVLHIGPGDARHNRRPAYISVGTYKEKAHQSIWFSKPKLLADNDGIGFGVQKKIDVATYPSFFEYEGIRYFWYPDRKHFLLGKFITDELLRAEENG